MSGKGSKPRPFSVTQEEYANRWDAIFGRDLDDNTKTKIDDQDINEDRTQIKNNKELNNME